MPRQGVGVPHQDYEAAALAWPEAIGTRIENPHLGASQRAALGESHQFKWIDAQVHSARQGHPDIADRQRGARRGHRQQRRRARAIHRVAAALQIEVIRDASRNGVGETARQRVFPNRRKRLFVRLLQAIEEAFELVALPALGRQRGRHHASGVRPAQPQGVRARELAGQRVADVHSRGLARQVFVKARIRQRLVGDIQRQPMRQIRRAVCAAGYVEAGAIEFVILDQRCLHAIGAVGRIAVGRVVIRRAQALGRNAAEGAPPRQCVLP